MQSFRINGPADPIELEGGGAATAFVVTNTNPEPLRGTVAVRPQGEAAAEWFTIRGEATRHYAPGAIEHVTVDLAVPSGTTAGDYAFRLDAFAEEDPDWDYTEGPKMAFTVPAPPPPVPWWRRYWWALAIAAAVVIAAVILVVVLSGGDDVTLRSKTKALASQVDSTVQSARVDARAWSLAAAAEVQTAIDDTESAYARDLDEPLAKAPRSARDDVGELQRIAGTLAKGDPASSREAARSARTLAAALRFEDRNPRITDYSPAFVTQGGTGSLRVRVEGEFARAVRDGKPRLRIGERAIEADVATAQALEFPIPAGAVQTPAAERLASVAMDLEIAYETGDAGPFRLLVGVLPDAPAQSLALTNAVTTTSEQFNAVAAPAGAPAVTWTHSASSCVREITERAAATPGWKVVLGSARLEKTEDTTPGGHGVEMSEDESGVTTVATVPITFCGDDCPFFCRRVAWYVTYTEHRTVETTADQSRPVPVSWGDKLTIGVTPGRWRLEGTLFDGTQVQTTKSDRSSPYLSVEDRGDTVVLRVPATDGFLAE